VHAIAPLFLPSFTLPFPSSTSFSIRMKVHMGADRRRKGISFLHRLLFLFLPPLLGFRQSGQYNGRTGSHGRVLRVDLPSPFPLFPPHPLFFSLFFSLLRLSGRAGGRREGVAGRPEKRKAGGPSPTPRFFASVVSFLFLFFLSSSNTETIARLPLSAPLLSSFLFPPSDSPYDWPSTRKESS